MASEAVRALVRIGANYIKLLATLALGVVLIPLMLGWQGNDAVAIMLLIVASAGFAYIFQELSQRSIVREIGAAYHAAGPRTGTRAGRVGGDGGGDGGGNEDGGEREFLITYNSAYILTSIAAGLSVLVFVGFYFLLPFFDIPPALLGAAGGMLAGQGLFVVAQVFAAPAVNMFIVQERFGWHAFWTIADRSAYVLATLILEHVWIIEDKAAALTAWGLLVAAMEILLLAISAVQIMLMDRRLIPRPRLARGARARTMGRTFGWNAAVQISVNLYERLPQLIVNWGVGITAGLAFSLAMRLVSYVKMATNGMTFGLDAVSTRLSASPAQSAATGGANADAPLAPAPAPPPVPDPSRAPDDPEAPPPALAADDPAKIIALVRDSNRLHALVALPAGLLVGVLAEPLLQVWFGRQIQNPGQVIPQTALLTRVVVGALVVRSVCDGWIMILYGAGHIRRYAPPVVIGGVLNPILGVALIWALPEGSKALGPAIAFGIIVVGIHLLILPVIARRCLGTSLGDLFAPMARPLLATVLASPIPLAAMAWIHEWTLLHLAGVAAVFGAVYAALAGLIVFSGQERARAIGFARRKLGQR